MSTTQEKEFHTALRKNLSVIQNAFYHAQVDEGIMGDNSAIVASSEIKNTSDLISGFAVVKGLSKYINTNKYCTGSSSTSDVRRCDSNEIKDLRTRWEGKNPVAFMWLLDGSIYAIYSTFGFYQIARADSPIENEQAWIFIDVNGDKKPNKWGKDLYLIKVTLKKFEVFDNPDMEPSENMTKILLNKK